MKQRNTAATAVVVRSKDLQALPRQTYKKLFQLSMLCVVILLFGGGSALLWHLQLGNQGTHAQPDDSSVVSRPSLSAATVDSIFRQMGSPMVGTGQLIETTSRQSNIDDAFALGVWWTETNDGAAGVGSADRNPGSVRASPGFPAAYDGYTIYPSYAAAILDWFTVLKNRYIARGLTTVYAISYPYVGTSSSPLWAGKVIALMDRYRGIAPPPPLPTPTPKPKPILPPIKNTQPGIAIGITTYVQRQEARPLMPSTAQHTTPAVSLSTGSTNTLSPQLQAAIIVFGLLTAVAIAILGLTVGRKKPASAPAPTISPVLSAAHMADRDTASTISAAPTSDESQYVNAFSPLPPTQNQQSWQAQDVSHIPTAWPGPQIASFLEDIPSHGGGSKFRRITLLPSRPTNALQGEPQGSTVGLLSGYRETLQP